MSGVSYKTYAAFLRLFCCFHIVFPVHLNDAKCGFSGPRTTLNRSVRIIGGSEARQGSHPWLVSLRIRGSHFCAAAILTDHWLLTAAHCFASVSVDLLHSVEAVAGDFNLRKVDRGEQTFGVKTVKFHEKYQHSSPMSHDIALLEIKGRIQFGNLIKPVCLPNPGERFPPKTMCVVAGWGRIKDRGPLPLVLQEVDLDVVEQSRCKHVLQTLRPGQKVFTVLCAGPERGGRDACQGDSGGPLLCPRADGSLVAVGVTSWGKGCGRSWNNNKIKPPSRRGSPGVFTDVSLFLLWIKINFKKGWYCFCNLPLKSLCSVEDGAVSDSKGIIRNPAHSEQSYNNNEICLWSIRVTGGKHVLLEFQEFGLENDMRCQSDHLTVFVDGKRRIGQFCGSQSPSPVLIVGSQSVTVQFVSDVSRTGTGFIMQFSDVEEEYSFGAECGTVVLLQSKEAVQSPAHPQPYNNNTLCRWVIYAPEGYIVKLNFNDFDLEESENCQYDSLTVFGDINGEDEIVVVCGRSVPPAVLSSSHIMVLQFSTDSSVYGRGFNAFLSFISRRDLRDTAYEDKREEADDNSKVILPHLRPGLSCTYLYCYAYYSDSFTRGSFETSYLPRNIDRVGEFGFTTNTQWHSIDFTAACGIPDVYAVSGLDALRKAEDDGIHAWLGHVSIGLGAGHECSGVIIRTTWILTVAHCVYNLEEKLLRFITVRTGSLKEQTHDVIRVLIHPHFNSSSLNYNAALLQLNSPFNLGESTRPVCLPSAGQEIPPSLLCWAAAWTSQMSGHGRYQSVQLKISVLERTECEQHFRSRLTPTMLCAGLTELDTAGSCMYQWIDSGGPLFCLSNISGVVLMGVKSWGEPCGGMQRSAVYTSVPAVMHWVSQQLDTNWGP
ncbi:ovochymase-2-like [Triplophysa rosa]|uniref:ovochymase-2-like n=1 Tax=Triplophysa rosa TaxID=992332 RepID=UPI00254611A1|nr:ovochymase-2-like [Triplophysa rosa]